MTEIHNNDIVYNRKKIIGVALDPILHPSMPMINIQMLCVPLPEDLTNNIIVPEGKLPATERVGHLPMDIFDFNQFLIDLRTNLKKEAIKVIREFYGSAGYVKVNELGEVIAMSPEPKLGYTKALIDMRTGQLIPDEEI